MKLLLLISSLNSGGAERVMSLLANHWAEQGHAVTLMATYGRYVPPAYALDPRIELLGPTGGDVRAAGGRLRRLQALRRVMRNGGFDGAISFLTNVNIAAIIARAGLPLPLVVGERTYPPSMPISPTYALARRRLYRFADTVVMQTQDAAEWLSSAIPSARAAVIPNPLRWPIPDSEPAKAPSTFVPENSRLLLSMGRLSPEKRFDLLLEAFASLGEEAHDWRLVIGGEGPMREALDSLVMRLGLADRVTLPGQIGNVAAWYRRADAFALTSSFEGYPNALLEAAASEVPVAAIDCLTGVRGLVVDGLNGVLAPRTADAVDFAGALRTVLTGAWPGVTSHAADIRRRHAIGQIGEQWLACLRAPGR